MREGSDYWQGFWRGRVSRRRMLQGAALGSAALAATVVVGCAEGEKTTTAPTTAAPMARQPRKGGIITRAGGSSSALDTSGEPVDPHTVQSTTARTYRLVYQGLLGYDLLNYDPQPELAQAWEQASPTEYIFTLAPGVKWHNKPPANGRELKAEDVVFSFERVRSREPRFIHRSLLAAVDKVEVVDKGRVKITTRKPDVSTLNALSADGVLVLAGEVVEAAKRFLTAEEVVGTGAFTLKSLQERVAGGYVASPDYWKAGLPYLEGVRTPYFADEQSGFAAFLGGKLDIARVPGSLVKKYLEEQGPNYVPYWYKQDASVQLTPNTKAKPFNDPRVTRALRLLADYREFIAAWAEVLFGRGFFASIFPTALDSWDATQQEYAKHSFWKEPKDEAVREALGLLEAAGFNRSNPLQFELATQDAELFRLAVQLLQAQWRRLGQGVVETQLKIYDSATSNTVRARKTFAYGLFGNSGAIPEPAIWLNQLWRSDGSRNYMGINDPKVDSLIDTQNSTFDSQQRKAIVKEIVLYMMEHSPGGIISNRFNLNSVNPKVQKYAPEYFMNGRQYEWIWLDT